MFFKFGNASLKYIRSMPAGAHNRILMICCCYLAIDYVIVRSQKNDDKRNLRNYWNRCKCCVVYASQCLTLVLHLISTLVNRLLKVIMLVQGLGMSIGWFPDSWIIYNQNKLCSKVLLQLQNVTLSIAKMQLLL